MVQHVVCTVLCQGLSRSLLHLDGCSKMRYLTLEVLPDNYKMVALIAYKASALCCVTQYYYLYQSVQLLDALSIICKLRR